MWSCDPSLVTLAFMWEKLSYTQFYKDLPRKTAFFEGWFSFKLNNQGLALGADFKFYTSVAKGLKQKFRQLRELISILQKLQRKNWYGRDPFCPPPPPPSWLGLTYRLQRRYINICIYVWQHIYFDNSTIIKGFQTKKFVSDLFWYSKIYLQFSGNFNIQLIFSFFLTSDSFCYQNMPLTNFVYIFLKLVPLFFLFLYVELLLVFLLHINCTTLE